MALPPYTSPLERAWHYTLRGLCALIFLFLIGPIIVIIPLSFNSEPYFTYPMAGYSLRWYEEILGSGLIPSQWQSSIVNSVIIGICAASLATLLGTLAALGMTRAKFPFKGLVMAVLISPIIVPIVITAVGMFYFYAKVGLVSNLFGIILAHAALGAPFVVITVTATLVGFDQNLVRCIKRAGGYDAETLWPVRFVPVVAGTVNSDGDRSSAGSKS